MDSKKDDRKAQNPQPSKEAEKTDQEVARKDKLERLVREGVEIFPYKAETTHSVSEIVGVFAALAGDELEQRKAEVKAPGRILSIRRMGRATFFTLSDSQKKLQIYLREDTVGERAYKLFDLFDIGDVVAVQGVLFKTRTGELTVLAKKYWLLAKCLHPLPEKWHGLQDVELRYRKRYLDLIMNPDVGEVFRLRSRLISLIRDFFDTRGYIEVETPMMHAVPGGALARPFKTYHNALGIELYLRIAPELYLKKLVVGGFEKVYEINRNFRNEGISSEHNPEFTMLEFYEAYADYHDMMEITEELVNSLSLSLLGKQEIVYGGQTISLKRPWKRIRFRDAITQHSGIAPGRFDDRKGIVELASTLAPEKAPLTYGKALDIIFDKHVKPNLVQPTFVINPPKEVSPLAKASKENPEEAERFELIMAGMEIANAFSELTDPRDQGRRFEEQAEERRRGNEDAHWVDINYIQALEYGLPPTGGEGIGIDRLTMIFADKKSIREVILFPLLRPKEEL